jgi:putative serine protease PepD
MTDFDNETTISPRPDIAESVTGPAPGDGGRAANPNRRRYGAAGVASIALVAALIGAGAGAGIARAGGGDTAINSVAAAGDDSPGSPSAASSQAVASKVLPSVVTIFVRGRPSSGTTGAAPFGLLPFPFDGGPGSGRTTPPQTPSGSGDEPVIGTGSGVVISKDGLILTNDHVAGAGDLSVAFKDGRTVKAKLVKADDLTDLAVIRAEGITDATPISYGHSADLRVGQPVLAIGAPLGLNGTVTEGIISALHRPVDTTGEAQRDGRSAGAVPQAHVTDAIQTDAPINPGNSGGALVDMNGQLIGITSAIAGLGSSSGGQSGSIGLGFAIPVDQAEPIAKTLAAGNTVKHALLGVEVADYNAPTQTGAQIGPVVSAGPAAAGGLQSGDIVTKVDDRLIDSADALIAAVRSHRPGDNIAITVVRAGKTRIVHVTLGDDSGATSRRA